MCRRTVPFVYYKIVSFFLNAIILFNNTSYVCGSIKTSNTATDIIHREEEYAANLLESDAPAAVFQEVSIYSNSSNLDQILNITESEIEEFCNSNTGPDLLDVQQMQLFDVLSEDAFFFCDDEISSELLKAASVSSIPPRL